MHAGASLKKCTAEGPPKSGFSSTVYTGAMVPEGSGGGLAALNGAHLELVDAAVNECTAGNLAGGAFAHGAGASLVVTRTTFTSNWAGAFAIRMS